MWAVVTELELQPNKVVFIVGIPAAPLHSHSRSKQFSLLEQITRNYYN